MELADYSILSKDVFNNVYEPSEDTFILIDALEKDLTLIKKLSPTICLEIGSGSGVVTATIGKVLECVCYFCTDLNPVAATATRATCESNNVPVDVVITDLILLSMEPVIRNGYFKCIPDNWFFQIIGHNWKGDNCRDANHYGI